ncbi:hypothetical protein [Jonquetella anthropi]|uniref:hypothetical protein n=1 Tax=Jonquetella anthropi TaxID=428712 RepID=UPI0001B9104D|nr:hypothetical protein [Jonquetella anthropi]EEX49097.1 hypothetical protein GCWU000246_00183 [Jonquetella anthropi E3_33 E1]
MKTPKENKFQQSIRTSVGNALRDIREKYPDLIRDELKTWRLEGKEIKQTYRLANAFLAR